MKEKEYRLKTLFWEATLRCNAFCEFCGSRCGEVSCNEISGEKIEKVFEDIADAYNPGSIMINVTGGEPILRKDLFEVMTKASAMGFPWGMVSNGSLIDKCTIQKMKQSGMKTISISLDGMKDREWISENCSGYKRFKASCVFESDRGYDSGKSL